MIQRFLGILCLLILPNASAGQGTVASDLYPPDARSQGMGRAFTAIAEGPSAVWWNPGALAFPQPLSVCPISFSQLIPELADDVYIYGAGATVQLDKVGIGAHLSYINYGRWQEMGEGGEPGELFHDYDFTLHFGVGADLAGTLGIGSDPGEASCLRWGLGVAPKIVRVSGGGLQYRYYEEATALDLDVGTLFSYRRNFPGLPREGRPSYLGIRGGLVMKNALNQALVFSEESKMSLDRYLRCGIALEGAAVDLGTRGHALRGFLSADWEGMHSEKGWSDEVTRFGAELCLLGIFSLRGGRINDPEGHIEDWTWGLGVGVDLYDVGVRQIGGRIDFAGVPRGSGIDRDKHFTLSGWIGL